jgi:flagellar biosynthesis protein FlhA
LSAQATRTGARAGQTLFAAAILGIIGILIIPLPAWMMDFAIALNLGLSVMVLINAMGLPRALDFSAFPSVLLILTLFRLGLNVATTRLVLSDGSKGASAAGHVIETFGRFVIGGSVVVGIVVFLILLIVNFTVITKGSGRVSEVAARFTLDALPGKQMSIDADLAAGVIDDRQAKERRVRLEQETEFFGAMDGASKFVRGDAIAGLIITAINIVGGLALGLVRDNMPLDKAFDTYTVLTVGDGLVSQIPALLVSTAAGLVVTRAAGEDLATQVTSQLFEREDPLLYTAAVMGFIGLLPEIPFLPFAALAGGAYALSRRAGAKAKRPNAAAAPKPGDEKDKPAEKLQDLLSLDAVELSVGYALLPLIDVAKNGELPGRITALRKQLASDIGIVLPSVHLRDNLRLQPNEYEVKLRGNRIAHGVAYPDRLMALDPGGQQPKVEGLSAKEPAFGLPAVWVLPKDRSNAEAQGLTLVDPGSMITTHLSELLRRHAHELVGRQEVQDLLSVVSKEAPKLVEDAIPSQISLAELVRVVRGLLREDLSVRDLKSILEAVADAAPRSKETPFLVEQARRRLMRQITAKVADPKGVVHAITFDRATEEMLRASLGANDGEPAIAPDLDTARKLIDALESKAGTLSAAGHPIVVLAPPDLRRPFFDFACRFVNDLTVICVRELVPGTSVDPVATIQVAAPPGAPALGMPSRAMA